jgi:2-oxoglutarate dehydrogenase E2 component (dihydrolipoamide succinyltransferase)
MSIAVELPALGESVVEGTVSKWLVKEGDRVEVDEPLVEVTTDKVDAEIPAPASGVVEQLLVSEGETLAVGQPLLLLATVAETFAAAAPTPPPGDARARRATPVARRLAVEAHVDLRGVEGTGPSGRVTKHDLQRHTATDRTGPAVAAEPARAREPEHPAFLHYSLQSGDRVIPMSPLRRLVAEHMVLSKRVSPHVGTVAEVDLGDVVRVRDAHKRAFLETHGFRLSFLPFVIHATVRALREFPRLNASVLEDAIVEKGDIHIGVAVETDKGLVVPVLRHADRLSVAGLAQAVEDLAVRARSKKLSADELQPQVGILRLGEIVKRPVVRTVAGQDAIAIRPLMHLALSYDHRAVDGAPANGFLFRVRQLLEEAEFDL